MILDLGAAALVLLVWCWASWEYRRVFRARLRWWAMPLAHGSLLWGRALPDRFHVPAAQHLGDTE